MDGWLGSTYGVDLDVVDCNVIRGWCLLLGHSGSVLLAHMGLLVTAMSSGAGGDC